MNGARVLAVYVFGLASCRVGPRHEGPCLDLPAAFVESGNTAPAEADETWWRGFGDPTLDRLIERAIAGSTDLAIARARVREARALRDSVAGTTRPQIDARASASRNGPSESGAFQRGADYDLYEIGFDAAWEIDSFGRLGASVDAAEAGIGSAEEERQSVLVTLLGEVAREYVSLRGAQREVAIVRSNLVLQRDTYELTRGREQAGFVPALDVARSLAQVEDTAASIPALEADARASIHRLGVLVGDGPGALASELEVAAPIPLAPAEIAVGVPLDVVRRRPDVRRAERELARETALTAQATAELYPRLILSGGIGQQSQKLSELFESGNTAWSLGAGLLAPIFRGGTLRANVRAQEARREQAAISWKATVLEALREVEDALSQLAGEREREQRLTASVAASRRAVELAGDLNTQGLADFFQVIEAQRTLLAAESQLARSQTEVTARTVVLYKSLGGAPPDPGS